ncbi:MAG: inositol monophosphatase family protein [Planctomycetota bacterium]|jgi:myo-inositol-1(or 4)-monophosphatase
MTAKQDCIKVCEKAARAGGHVLVDMLGRVTAREKGRHDLVTEADLASQQIVRRTVLEAFPDHALIGEEAEPGDDGPSFAGEGPAEYRWIVDPLDGTTNYVHQVPHFCVSLALERKGRLLVGAVYNPVSGELYTASADGGAFLDGRPIRTSNASSLSQSLAAVGFPAEVSAESPDLRLFLKALDKCQSIRRTGSAALNLCYLAAGRFDVSWSFSTKIWDVAAGILIAREAGGEVSAPDGGPFALREPPRYVAAANRQLHAELTALVGEAGLA